MGTMVEFKRVIRDHARLEPAAEIAIGTTTFSGDGERLFLQHNGVGLLLSDDDAKAFIAAVKRAAKTLGVRDE